MRTLLLFATLALAACAHGASDERDDDARPPAAGAAPAAPTCEVWVEGMFGRSGCNVENGHASMKGLFGRQPGAYFRDAGGAIVVDGMFGTQEVATLAGDDVTFRSLFGGSPPTHIGEHEARVPGLFGDTPVHFNERCSKRDVAAGVVTIVLASQQH